MSERKGWVYINGATKWHYVNRGGQSLCAKWLYLGKAEPEQGNDDSPDNCRACRKGLTLLNAKGAA